MHIPPEVLPRLYELYQAHFTKLSEGVRQANLSLGCPPDKADCRLPSVSCEKFANLLAHPRDEEVAKRWIKRIIHNHESEFSVDFLASLETTPASS